MISRTRWASLAVVLGSVCGWCAPLSAGQAMSWEEAFPVESAKSDVYFDAHFVGSDGGNHRLQLWRQGTEFLHRRTDETLDLYLRKLDNEGDFTYRLFDHRRRMLISVNRNHLYRIGIFSDWFGLAHVLDRPKSRFSVRAVAPLPEERNHDCCWRLLVREVGTASDRSRVCWSAKWGGPLVIRTLGPKGKWIERFTMDRVYDNEPPNDGFIVPPMPDGYVYFDARKEITPKPGQ
jgi:hypothetical protein